MFYIVYNNIIVLIVLLRLTFLKVIQTAILNNIFKISTILSFQKNFEILFIFLIISFYFSQDQFGYFGVYSTQFLFRVMDTDQFSPSF